MRRGTSIWALVVALALTAGTVPAAAETSVTVRMPACLNPDHGNGQWSVPAGSQITIASAWADKRGIVMRLVDATTVAASVNGTSIANTDTYWGPVTRETTLSERGSLWKAEWSYDTGIVLENPGDEMVVHYSWVLSREIRSGQDSIGPGEVFGQNSCTITASDE